MRARSLVSRVRKFIDLFSLRTRHYSNISQNSPVNAWNEWDPLEEIIVGTPENATVPKLLPEVKICVSKKHWAFFEANAGRYWADVIAKEHWDMLVKQVNNFVHVLEQEGVKVVRPHAFDHRAAFRLLGFESQGFYAAMPRDFLLVIGNELIEASMTWRSRFFEYVAYRPLLLDYWRQGAKWTVAPKPTDFGKLFNEAALDYSGDVGGEKGMITTESEPCFDAADFIRAGRDIFAQRSQVTNLAGIEWVRRHLAPQGIRVHRLTFDDPRPMHIDATFALVKPGVAFQNPERPCRQSDKLKAAGWNIYEVPKPVMKTDRPLWLGSMWLLMNTVMLDPNRVIVEAEETGLQELYKRVGVTSIPVPFAFANSIGGGFHCYSSDVRRRGTLQSYFDWTKGGEPNTK